MITIIIMITICNNLGNNVQTALGAKLYILLNITIKFTPTVKSIFLRI